MALRLEVKGQVSVFTDLWCVLFFSLCIYMILVAATGESIPIRLFLAGYDMTPTMKDVNKKFSVRFYLNLVLIDEGERRYFKQQVCCIQISLWHFYILICINL